MPDPVAPPTAEPDLNNKLVAELDRWSGTKPKPQPSTPPVQPPTPPEAPPAAPAAAPAPEQPAYKLPSFVTEGDTPPAPPAPAPEEEFPVEPPEAIAKDPKQKANWEKFRGVYDSTKKEKIKLEKRLAELEARGQQPDEATTKRLQQLEHRNQELEQQFQKTSIENNPDFINSVLRPMHGAYEEAKRIIKDAGGEEASLDRALALSGKAHYDAMDDIMRELPDSAKRRLDSAVARWQEKAQQRANALADAPRFYAELQRRTEQQQHEQLTRVRQENEQRFEVIHKFLRDDVKFPLFRRTDDPDLKWWNDLSENVLKEGRTLFLENQDLNKVAEACLLAPAALALNQMWQKAENRAAKAEKELSALRGSEPTMSGSGGAPNASPVAALKTDMKRPIGDVFIDVLKNRAWEKK